MKLVYKRGLKIILCVCVLLGSIAVIPMAEEETGQTACQIGVVYREKDGYESALESFERRFRITAGRSGIDEEKKREVLSVPEDKKNFLLSYLGSRGVADHVEEYNGVWNEQPESVPRCAGEGTEESPYQIGSEAELENLRYHNMACFELTGDIELEEDWEPIEWFGGSLEGKGYRISNLNLVTEAEENAGFFGELSSSGKVKQLTVEYREGAALSGAGTMGILAGKCSGKIKNCITRGSIEAGENSIAGGMTGILAPGGQIRTSCAAVNIGSEEGATAGGLAGKTSEGTQIQDCYSEGSLEGTGTIGGINGSSEGGEIERVYANMEIETPTENGIVGEIQEAEKVEVSGAYLNSSKLESYPTELVNGIEIKEETELQQAESYEEWDFENIWEEDEEGGLPKLRMTEAFASNGLEGSGTEADPFQIATKEDLDKVRENLSACYIQTADIEFSEEDFAAGGDFYNDGNGFMPIGYEYWTETDLITDVFTGKYDGNGHIIENLYIYNMQYQGVGLFGAAINFQSLENIHLRNADITGSSFTGGIGGDVIYGDVTCCSFDGNVTSCSYDGAVPASGAETAGIVGGCDSGVTISKCINYGTISGNTDTGGICGYIRVSYIQDCLNMGDISGTDKVAGINGEIYESGDIKRCYNVGSISNSGTGIGAITGTFYNFDLDYDSSVNNYYLSSSNYGGTSYGDKAGAYTALTEEQMKQQSSFVGFDFENVWTIDPTAEYPYPTLRDNPIMMEGGGAEVIQYDLTCTLNDEYDIYVNVGNMENIQNQVFTVTYNPQQLELEDGCAMTEDADLSAGIVANTKVTIVSVDTQNGSITFQYDEAVTAGETFSGTVNVIKFTAKTTGSSTVGLSIEEGGTEA